MNNNKDKVMVTVLCTTYNHASYIRDALEGIRTQKTDFRYDCFIFDDASTDGTSDIVREYVKKYPDIFRAYISPENLYARADKGMDVRVQMYKRNTFGKYIALCEGDDYWIDNSKLQSQVEVLEKNDDVSLVTHAYRRIDSFEKEEEVKLGDTDGDLLPDVIFPARGGNLATASLVTRRCLYFASFDDLAYPSIPAVNDYTLILYLICYGRVFYINRVMSVYRFMMVGSWSKRVLDDIEQYLLFSMKYLNFLESYNGYSDGRFREHVKTASNQHIVYLASRICGEIDDEKRDRLFRTLRNDDEGKTEYIDAVSRCCMIIDGRKIENSYRIKLENKERVIVFGCGFYSGVVESMVNNWGLDVYGFLVTKKESDTYNGKPLWDINDYPYGESDGTLLVMGVGPTYKTSVLKSVERIGVSCIAPLWDNYCTWL